MIPTEPIGSIPRPLRLLDALAAHEGEHHPVLDALYEDAVRDTIERFEATGSPVVTDGEQRKYHNFWTYCVHGLPNMAPDGFRIPFAAGHTRRMPRLTAGPFRYKRYAHSYLEVALRYAKGPVKQAVISPSALSLLYPAQEIAGYTREQFIDDLLREHETEVRSCLRLGAHKVQIDFTEGRLAVKLDPSGELLKSFIHLNNLALSRFSTEERQRIGVHTFGHSKVGVFTERAERLVVGIAAQASVAIDNARLFDETKRVALERERLIEAEQAARSEMARVSRLKDEFLATLSHELRTPLTAVLGWARVLLRKQDDTATLERGLEAIERNAVAQARLIDDLLDMNRIISGKVRLDVQPTDLSGVIDMAVDAVRPSAEGKDIRLRVVADPTAGPVSGDPHRLQQVIWNLLTNAVKFTPRGGRVDVVLQRVSSHLELSVSDSGIGIAPDFLPHVFDRFRQADSSITRSQGGLGLGLSIVKQLVELHGGSVRAKSEGENTGTIFIVALPLAAVRPRPHEEHPAAVPGGAGPQVVDVSLRGLKILLVDDEADARELVKQLLGDCHAEVHTAASASEALLVLQQIRPDLLLSDIGMPECDGYQLIRDVRRLTPERGGKTPAIALTAFARSDDRTRAMLAGYQVHMAKPIEPYELLATVASLAGRMGNG